MRIIPEWKGYDDEVKNLFEKYEKSKVEAIESDKVGQKSEGKSLKNLKTILSFFYRYFYNCQESKRYIIIFFNRRIYETSGIMIEIMLVFFYSNLNHTLPLSQLKT